MGIPDRVAQGNIGAIGIQVSPVGDLLAHVVGPPAVAQGSRHALLRLEQGRPDLPTIDLEGIEVGIHPPPASGLHGDDQLAHGVVDATEPVDLGVGTEIEAEVIPTAPFEG